MKIPSNMLFVKKKQHLNKDRGHVEIKIADGAKIDIKKQFIFSAAPKTQ
jgi:hypothetical protein